VRIIVITEGITRTPDKEVQPPNAMPGISVNPVPNVRVVNNKLLEKEPSPIDVSVLGKTKVVKELLANVYSPIVVISLGRENVASAQFSKQLLGSEVSPVPNVTLASAALP
jgi:hypothetical protein